MNVNTKLSTTEQAKKLRVGDSVRTEYYPGDSGAYTIDRIERDARTGSTVMVWAVADDAPFRTINGIDGAWFYQA